MSCCPAYGRKMQLNRAHLRDELSVARRLMPILVVVFDILAIIVDPTKTWWRAAVLLVPILIFAAWYQWAIPLSLVALGVLIAVPIAQWAGELEPSMFLVSVLALCAVAWEPNRFIAYTIVLFCVLTPWALSTALPFASISWAPWVGGTIYPAFLGWTIRRQEALTVELARARRELAERAVLDERRRIARDVHDLVGHGLAAILLQVTSARHVLRRDPDSADEALRSAQDVGRQSMQDLRTTVDLLRRSDDGSSQAPPPDIARIAHLVGTYVDAGLAVDYHLSGNAGLVTPAAGLTLYRICQESLANISKHAPRASSRVTITVAPRSAVLTIHNEGPISSFVPDGAQGHYGLVGMRERADAVGGDLQYGPTDTGWLVQCEVPIRADWRPGLELPKHADS